MADKVWQDRCVDATRGNQSQLGTILLAAIGREPDSPPRYASKASITSDGFIICGFTGRDGRYYSGAFAGAVDDLQRNAAGLADHLALSPDDRAALYSALKSWIGIDSRDKPGLVFPR